jgi:hypothetical protein
MRGEYAPNRWGGRSADVEVPYPIASAQKRFFPDVQ